VRTERTILLILMAIALGTLFLAGAAVITLGERGALLVAGVAVVLGLVYRYGVGPWHRRWGATDHEVATELPGDDLVPGSTGSTRAITIAAPAAEVFPWIVQIGFGRAGWYSYDWIDNDGHPSAEGLVPNLTRLEVGDLIPMTPSMGFEVRTIDRAHHVLVGQAADGTSWAVVVDDVGGGSCRLVSRFRPPPARGVGPRLWTAIADPGAFVMERRMLLGIRDRAEARHAMVG
jgi:hypothetical protein